MIRKKKRFSRPKKAFEKVRIAEENTLLKKYALKNKREVWKTKARVDYFRRRAKALAKSSPEEQNILFGKLKALSLKTDSIADVLALKIEDLFERRLPTVIFKKKLAATPKQARQMVVHKKVLIDNKIVDSPSYLVSLSEENLISLRQKKAKPKPAAAESKSPAPKSQEQVKQ